eukprot:4813422-Prymnesium_polylepis.1
MDRALGQLSCWALWRALGEMRCTHTHASDAQPGLAHALHTRTWSSRSPWTCPWNTCGLR